MSTPTPPEPSTSPLGGRIRQDSGRDRFARRWTGYVPRIRACPACGTENDQHARFCVGCAASVADVESTPSQNPNSGTRAMEQRLRRESDEASRNRPFAPDAGTGFIITGIVLLLAAVWFPLPTLIRLGIWLAGLVSTGGGLFRMRFDGDAIRRTGLVLAAASVGLVVLVVTRGTPPADPSGLVGTSEPDATTAALATPVATPVAAGIEGSVVSWLGDAAHSGLQPGPAPDENPALAWRFDTGNEILASPVVADGIVFITNRAGFVYAVDASSGQQLWRTHLGPYVMRTTPAYDDGTLYLVAGFDALALDAATGDERWRTTIRYAGAASPTVADDTMYVASQEGWLYAFSTSDGSERWKISTDGISFGGASLAHGRLIVGTDNGTVLGINPETGNAAWRREFDAATYTTPVISGDTVWVVTDDGVIHGLALDDGDDEYRLETTSDLAVTATGDTVFAPAADGGMYAVAPENGEVRWFASPGGQMHAGPVRTQSQVMVTGGNRIAGLDSETGKQIWYFLAGDTIESPPAIVSGYVFFGARDGVLYALSAGPSRHAEP